MVKKAVNFGVRTWIEISKSALLSNYRVFRKLIGPKVKLMAVSKSNAYGHNLIEFSQTMQDLGVDWLGVDSILEGLKLRAHGITKPILVLGYTLPEMLAEAQKNNLSLMISQLDSLRAIKNLKNSKGLKIHLKIDSGMHRQGFLLSEIKPAIKFIKANLPGVVVEGIFTHFAAAKNPTLPQSVLAQIAEFDQAIAIVQSFGFKPIRHASATAGTLIFPQAHYDLVRVGIGLYGYWPSAQVQAVCEHKVKLQPILTWKTFVSEIKKLKINDKTGYDFAEVLTRPTVAAILPIGYWHGYPRALSGIGSVIIKNQKCRVLGRVSMDILVVDITGVKNIKLGEAAILLGADHKISMTADDLAALAETSAYEIITRLNPLIKKIYI